MTKRKTLTQAATRLGLHRSELTGKDIPAEARSRRTLPLELTAIDPGKRLRSALNEPAIERLTESMSTIGLQSPVLVKPAPEPGCFHLLAGAHRLEAAKQLGWDFMDRWLSAVRTSF